MQTYAKILANQTVVRQHGFIIKKTLVNGKKYIIQ